MLARRARSETLSNLQLELLTEEEPGVTVDEVEAEAKREPLKQMPSRERETASGAADLAGPSAARGESHPLRRGKLSYVRHRNRSHRL